MIIASLQPYKNELAACVVESSYNWYWLLDGLMEAGYQVRLGHTGAIPMRPTNRPELVTTC